MFCRSFSYARVDFSLDECALNITLTKGSMSQFGVEEKGETIVFDAV
jgi:hypothetical protein